MLKKFVPVRAIYKDNVALYNKLPNAVGNTLPIIKLTDHANTNYGGTSGLAKPDKLEPLLKDALLKMGPPITAASARKMSKLGAEAEKAFEAGKYGEALKKYRMIAKIGGKTDPAVKAAAKEQEIVGISSEKLDEAQAKADAKDYAAAAKLLAAVARSFPGTEAATGAKSAITKMKSNPEAAAVLKQLADSEAAGEALAKAVKYEESKKFSSALRAYEKLVKAYPDSDEAATAKEGIKRIEASEPDRAQAKAAAKIKSAMAMARSFAANGADTQAISYYQRVIKMAPGSREAAKAKAEIAKLQ